MGKFDMMDAIKMAVFLSTGFTLPLLIGSYIWEKRPFALIAIPTIAQLLGSVAAGAAIGWWGA